MRHKNSEICIFKCFVFFLLSLLSQVKEFRKTCFIFWYQSPVSTPVVASSNTIYHNVMIHQQQKLYDNSTFSGNLLAMIRILSYHYVRSIIFSEDGIGRMLKLLLQLEQSLHFTSLHSNGCYVTWYMMTPKYVQVYYWRGEWRRCKLRLRCVRSNWWRWFHWRRWCRKKEGAYGQRYYDLWYGSLPIK